jgi:predicted RNA-binding protein with PIN domain
MTGPIDPHTEAQQWKRLAELAIRLTVADPPPSSSRQAELLRMARNRRFTAVELDRIRGVIEDDADFRARLRAAINVDLVGHDIATWLLDPSTDAPSQRRRRAAEAARDRAQAERDGLQRQVTIARQTIAQRDESLRQAEHLVELGEQRIESLEHQIRRVQSERDAARAELVRQQAAWEQSRSNLNAQLAELIAVRDDLIRQRGELDQQLADLASDLAGRQRDRRVPRPMAPDRRQPLGVPGGLLADSVAAARFLLDRTEVMIVIDGYNTVLDPWTQGHLSQRRHLLLTLLDGFIAHRGPRVLVVFDGAVDAGGGGERWLSRVVYSPVEVTADDVICAEIERLPTSCPVVVVTDDLELTKRVRRQGATTVSVAQCWGVLRP